MLESDDLGFDVKVAAGTVRLFPLPSLVLFPRVMQPLHLFEPRYRDLLREALAGDRLIAMATLAAGWERDYEGRPRVYPTVCVGRIVACRPFEDGSSNLLLLGLCRARVIHELPPRKRFREAEVEVLDEEYGSAAQEVFQRQDALRRRLRDALGRVLPKAPQIEEHFDQFVDGSLPLGALADMISYALDLGVDQKHALLAQTNVDRRIEMLLGHLATAAADVALGPAGMHCFPPCFSHN